MCDKLSQVLNNFYNAKNLNIGWDYKPIDCGKKEAGRNRNWISCQVEEMAEFSFVTIRTNKFYYYLVNKSICTCQNTRGEQKKM